MHILHVLSQRPDSTGSGISIQAMIAQAAAKGHENRLLAGVDQGQRPKLTCIGDDCCGYVLFNGGDLPFPVAGMSDAMPYRSTVFGALAEDQLDAYEAAFAARLQEATADFRPDLIHCHHLWIVTSLVRRMFPEIPVVATCHGSDLRQFRNCPHLRERVLAGCRDLDAVLALSRAQRRDIIELYGLPKERVEVVGAGFDRALFRPGPKATAEPVRLVYAGKLSRAKGVPWMLRALENLYDRGWMLDLVGGGDGPEKRDILEAASDMDGRVMVHGPVAQADLARIMGRCHVFVLPSLFEGLPLVLLEAMACGCRIVSTALPGVAELLGDFKSPRVSLAALPRLIGADTPDPRDEDQFVESLRAAMAEQIDAALPPAEGMDPDTEALLADHTWEGVFNRVEKIYDKARAR